MSPVEENIKVFHPSYQPVFNAIAHRMAAVFK